MTNLKLYRLDDYGLKLDTQRVLSREYISEMLIEGAFGADSPIFDTLAAERFARDSH